MFGLVWVFYVVSINLLLDVFVLFFFVSVLVIFDEDMLVNVVSDLCLVFNFGNYEFCGDGGGLILI